MSDEEKQGWRKVIRSLCDQADSTCVYGAWQMWWKDADGKWIKPVCYDIKTGDRIVLEKK